MKKKIGKIIVALLMIGCVLIEGCGQKDTTVNKDIPMGRFIEEDITGDLLNLEGASVQGMLKNEEGKIQLFLFENGLKTYEQDDAGSWKAIEDEWTNKLNQLDFGGIDCMTKDKQGNIYMVYSELEGDALITRVAKVTGQELKTIKVAWQNDRTYKMPNSISILENGDMLIADRWEGIERYSLSDGRFIRSYEGKPSSLTVIDNKMYQINSEQGKIEVYDLETGKLERSIPCENIDSYTRFVDGDNGDFYLVGEFGVKHLTQEGTVWELLVDGNLTSFSMPSYSCTQAQIVNGDVFAVFAKNEGGFVLKKYTYSKDTPTTPTTEIIAYSLKENACLRQIAAQYQLSHPSIKVTLQVGLDKDSTLTEADAVKALNTELMAGNGPDLILLDGLNIDTYIEKGILADMGDWAKSAESFNQCFENIISAYQEKDKLYALPVHFTVPMLWGDKKVTTQVKSIEDLAAYKVAHPSEDLTSYQTAEALIYKFGGVSTQAWFNEAKELQEDRIISFLEAVKALEKQGRKIEYNKGDEPDSAEAFQRLGCDLDDALYVAYSYAAVQFVKPAGMQDFLTCAATNKQRKGGDFTMLSGQAEGGFEPRSILGVNATSEKQDLAKDIIQMALSEVIQSVDIDDGFPVNRVSFEKWMKGKSFNKDMSYMFGSDIEGKECTVSVQWGDYDMELKKYYEECKKLKVPLKTDQTLLKIILDESKGYFEETMTAQEAAKAIKDKVEFYLAE